MIIKLTMPTHLQKNLGYIFKNINLLETALTHRSQGGISYERLEFLGDAILNFVIAEALYQHYSDATEGLLSRMRAALVNRDVLVELAQHCELQEFVRLGQGEMQSGGKMRPSILADAMEAIMGAIYLDGGLETCRERILSWLDSKIADPKLLDQNKDAKTTLQEWTQAHKHALPLYTVKKMGGKKHAQIFEVSCAIQKLTHVTEGKGPNRRSAEQAAAQAYLDVIKTIARKKS